MSLFIQATWNVTIWTRIAFVQHVYKERFSPDKKKCLLCECVSV